MPVVDGRGSAAPLPAHINQSNIQIGCTIRILKLANEDDDDATLRQRGQAGTGDAMPALGEFKWAQRDSDMAHPVRIQGIRGKF